MEIRTLRTQFVCDHNLPQAFRNIVGAFGYIHKISCEKDVFCPNQPERSKREDSQRCEMRCSEHCGNTVRDK